MGHVNLSFEGQLMAWVLDELKLLTDIKSGHRLDRVIQRIR